MTPLFFALCLACFACVAAVALRDHRRLRAKRASMLDDCSALLDQPVIDHGGDSFPKMRGRYLGYDVRIELIPDTMVVRRLPQLWLSVTLISPQPGRPQFGALRRYSGNEFYALTPQFKHRIEPPLGLPSEVLMRGDDAGAQSLVDTLRSPLARLLADAHIKEVVVTAKGLRIVRQAAEGRRGEHLLLRQATFDTARVPSAELGTVLAELDALNIALTQFSNVRAA